MRIQCSSCQRWIRLSPEAAQKFAGHQVKCPGCSNSILVPAEAPEGVAEQPVAATLPPAAGSSEQPSDGDTDAGDRPAAGAASIPQEHPSRSEPAADDPPAPGFPGISIAAPRNRGHKPSRAPIAGLPRRTLAGNRRFLMAVGGGVLAAVGLLIASALLLSGGGETKKSGGAKVTSPDSQQTRTPPTPGSPGKDQGMVEFQVPEADRSNMAIDVDGTPIYVQPRGPLEVPLAPGTHRIVLRRRGFQQVDLQLVVRPGDRTSHEPQWEPIVLPLGPAAVAGAPAGGAAPEAGGPPSFDAWLQDFEAARRAADETNKDIFVLFDGSDWCPYSVRMANELLFEPRFQSAVAWKYVLVFADFPRGDQAKAKVQDAARNRRLLEQFGVEGFPTVIVADQLGLPYGRLGYEPGGVDQFLEQVSAVQAVRDRRDALIEEVRLSQGREKVIAARRTFQLVASLQFASLYADLFQKWYEESQQADAGNAQGHQEAFFEIVWLARFDGIREGDRKQLEQLVTELAAWTQQQKFQDADRAGRMHLQAAVAMQHDVKAVERYAELGLGYQPHDPKLQQALEYLKAAAPTLNVLASGSGFVVGADGYVLTNRHVTEGEGQLVVRLPDQQESVPAKRVAADSKHDLALVQIPVPEGLTLQPLSIAAAPVSRGTRVGAFGYPLGDLVGEGLKLTTGIISSLDDKSEEGMLLLDCRINPGNSGGPLCNARGEVVGIVTAKSYSDEELDSYGLAIPSARIIEFLGQHLPGFTPAEAADADAAAAEWDAVDRIVSPSVLMLRKLRTAD